MSDVRATYRVQLHGGFRFEDVARIAPYLAELGITHVYCSPYLQAHPGSTHGYDVQDHSKLNEELGGRAGFDKMVEALEASGLKHIVDIVPNHVSIEGGGNSRWWDVLKNGRESRYAEFFDIDWASPIEDLHGKVMVPVLGDDAEAVIARGEITIEFESGEPTLHYFEHVLPIADGTHREGDVAGTLAAQHYLLANWRRAATDLNLRRFFDINTLAGLEMDRPGVYEETHALILDLVREGNLDGLRVDHIDGLKDPAGYLTRLKEDAGTYVVVEKILEPGERLPRNWPVEGTTGYDFLNKVGGLFVAREAEGRLDDLYRSFTGETDHLDAVTHAKKMLIMRQVMAADVARLTRKLVKAFEAQGWKAEEDHLRVAIEETIAAFEVYRTYISPRGERSEEDARLQFANR